MPSTRTTLIVLIAVIVIGFLNLNYYHPRLGLIWNVMKQDVGLGAYVLPYRYLLAACVAAIVARLLLEKRDT